jgi:hypothetical protein
MTYFVDEYKEYDCNECGIPKGSIIGIYGQFYKLSIWYVYAYYNKNITIVKLDDNHKLLENPFVLMISTEDLNYYIVDWNAYYIQISKDYISNFYRFGQPLYKVRYGDIINLSDYKDKYNLFFVMNFDPVTNTYMVLSMDQPIKKQYYSINIGLCNYYILSRKELRSNIVTISKEFTKKYIIDCYETLDIIDENICIKTKINFLLENSYGANVKLLCSEFLNDNLDTIKNDLEKYDNEIDNFQFEIQNNDILKQIFTKKNIENDENYINNINIINEEKNNSNISCPMINTYNSYNDQENEMNNMSIKIKDTEQNLIEFSYSSEEYEYQNKLKYSGIIEHYNNENPVFDNYLKCYNTNTYNYFDKSEQSEIKYYSDEDDRDDYQEDENTSYCSERYMYNNKYNADYEYEPSTQSSSQYSQEENYHYNLPYCYDNQDTSEDLKYEIEKENKNKINFDYDYINTLFENYYNANDINKETALDTIQSYNDDNELYKDMPKLISIDDYINNCCKSNKDNIVNNSNLVIDLSTSFTNVVNDNITLEKEINKIIATPEITNIQMNENKDEEEYDDININEIEPFTKNEEACSIM